MEGVTEKRLRSGCLLRIYRFGGEGNDWCEEHRSRKHPEPH
ncbi:hypothetical protein [Paenibacillus oceani]|nr:hypothetical protein [Paenibacillus oceani]